MSKIIVNLTEVNNISSLQDIESRLVAAVRELIQEWLENCEFNPPMQTTGCRECGKVANYTSMQTGYVRTQFGLISFKRARYLCPHCLQVTFPMDERLNPVESLARLRTKIAAGKILPVAQLAQTWGLGRLDHLPVQLQSSPNASLPDSRGMNSRDNIRYPMDNRHQIMPVHWQPI